MRPIAQKLKKLVAITLILLAVPFTGTFSQNVDDPPPDDPNLDDPDPNIPIDGGVSVLIVAGALVGARKVYIEKKKKQRSEETPV